VWERTQKTSHFKIASKTNLKAKQGKGPTLTLLHLWC